MNVRTIFIVGGQKGGVGKTSVCQAFCQYLLDGQQEFVLIEGDAQIDDVGRMYRDQVDTETIIISDDRAKASNPDVILHRALQGKNSKNVVVNLPSNILDVMHQWMKNTGLISILKEKTGGNVRLVKFFVTDGCYESIRQLEKSINMLDNSIPHVVVLNEGRVNAADFSYLEEQSLYTDLKKAPNFIGALAFPALEPGTRFYIDEQGSGLRPSLEKADQGSDFLKAQRIKNFIEAVATVFEEAEAEISQWFQRSDWANTGGKPPTSSSRGGKDTQASEKPRKGGKKQKTNAFEAERQGELVEQ